MKQRSIIQKHWFPGASNPGYQSFLRWRPYFRILLMAVALLPGEARAQKSPSSIKVTLNRSQVLIGEPIDLRITVKVANTLSLSKWYNLPDTFNHLEVLSRSPVDTVTAASGIIYQQHLTITGFKPGIWAIPSVRVVLSKGSVQADSIAVTIVPVQLKDSAYHGIREIIIVPEERSYLAYWIAGILSGVVLFVLCWLWIKSLTAKSTVRHNIVTPLQEALNGLQELSGGQLGERKEWKKYYSVLTGILKRYMERKFKVPAMHYTTDELLLQVQAKLGKDDSKGITETLRMADAVKFAKYQPAAEQATTSSGSIKKALQLLDQVKS